ncbi:hypothetical protein [uncultured Psychroserpens sp.]|uniref:hypothetical protein n=1 Tax=uncultured Psychroserpens sp. TaxID=255436 RepID=UPI002630FA62|nr:hypothetical protein [uncultured Psychroserpens sp.]
MKKILSILSLLVLINCGSVNKYTQYEHIITEGKGIDSFHINTINATDVKHKLGKDYDLIKHKDYSFQIVYKNLGMSFYYMQNDPEEQIFLISFKSPFNGKTSKNIVLNKSTMIDVVNAYGKPEWFTCNGCDTWKAEYDGIYFEVERDKSLPQYPLNEDVHIKKKIIGINISKG